MVREVALQFQEVMDIRCVVLPEAATTEEHRLWRAVQCVASMG